LFADDITPDRRRFDVGSYFPLAHKNEDGSLTYFGAFVPDLLERARTNGSKNAFQDAILLPKKAYTLDANGQLNDEDLWQVDLQVAKTLFKIVNDSRKKQENLNLYNVERMSAQDLYFDAKSNVAQSVTEAKAGELINIYGGARESGYRLPYVTPTTRERIVHRGLNLVGKFAALITGLGAGLAFAPAAPYLGVLVGAATYYIITSASQFDFWLKAEDLIRNNWALSPKHWKPKQIDWSKLAKTLGMAAFIGYLAFQGGVEMYAGAVNALVNFAQLPLFAAGAALSAKALLAIKTASGILSVTAAVGAFRGLMVVMHNFVGLGYSKTAVSPEERNALPVDDILRQNVENDHDYTARKKREATPSPAPDTNSQEKIKHLEQVLKNVKRESLFEKTKLTTALSQAQNPCVSKVVALKAIFDDLVAMGEITPNLENDAAYAAAFRAVTEQLPMNMGAWAPAQVFNNLTQEQKLKAIADFKAAGAEGRFKAYKDSPEYQEYLASDRYALDSRRFREYLQGTSFKLDAPKGDCCNPKAAGEGIVPIIDALSIIVTKPFIPVEPASEMLRTPEAVQFTRGNIRPSTPVAAAAANETPDMSSAASTPDEQLLEVPSADASGSSRSRSASRSPSPSAIRTQPPRAAKNR
jgi:hypothetical protein